MDQTDQITRQTGLALDVQAIEMLLSKMVCLQFASRAATSFSRGSELMRLPLKGEELKYQYFMNRWKEMCRAHLKEIGSLDILSAPIDWCLFSVKVCDAMVFSRGVRIAGGDGEAMG
jgi:hypothetical protein